MPFRKQRKAKNLRSDDSEDSETVRQINKDLETALCSPQVVIERQLTGKRRRVKIARREEFSLPSPPRIPVSPSGSDSSQEETLNAETKELLQIFSKLRGGPNIVTYFNSLPEDQRKFLLGVVQDDTTAHIARDRDGATATEQLSSVVGKPMLIRILEFNKNRILPAGLKLELIRRYFTPGSSPEKNMQWMETVLKTPFGLFAPRISQEELSSAEDILEKVVYGHKEAKHKIISYLAQLYRNQDSNGLILGLKSYPGVGKTNLVDVGVSKILKRNFYSTSLGGVHDSSFLRGFQYTYEGSEIGYIARCLLHCGVMNPVFFFDELDKVSQTPHGDEIINTLIQITDPIQSKFFQDRYLGSVATLDLSRCIFVFAYNDKSLINPILRDRITEIQLSGFTTEDKLIIAKDYMIPKIVSDIGFRPEELPVFGNELIKFLIEEYTNEAGVRHLRKILYEIYMEINMKLLLTKSEIPELNRENIQSLITTYRPIVFERTKAEKVLGRANGLFVDTNGCSGILPLEAIWVPSTKRASYEMRYTGNLGKVMGESTRVAWSVAWNLLESQRQNDWLKRWNPEGLESRLSPDIEHSLNVVRVPDRSPVFDVSSKTLLTQPDISKGCLHVHCRDNAMPKDGPSAGVALTVLMWSMLTDRELPQDIAYTGEIALHGMILPIGGLQEKIVGAERAGCKLVIYPKLNSQDLGKFTSTIALRPVETIQEVIEIIQSHGEF